MALEILVHKHLSPRIVEVLPPTTEVTVQEITDAIRAWEDSPEGMLYPYLLDAAGKEELGGGVLVGVTTTLIDTKLMFTGRATPKLMDNCTQDDTAGISLVAVGANFVTNSVSQGDVVHNMTTHTMAVIYDVVSEDEVTHFPLEGSADLEWEVGDLFMVYDNVQCSISGGNLVAVDTLGAEISPVLESPHVQIVRTSSSSATLQELESIQHSSFNGGVTVDLVDGVSGTEFPTGTPEQANGNWVDALTIAATRGFTTFFIIGDALLDDGSDFSGYSFIGSSKTKSVITISDPADVTECEFYDAEIAGILDGENVLKNCLIGDLNYVNGFVEQCILKEGTILLGGSEEAHFLDCWSGMVEGNIPIIDMGGSGQALGMRNYNGGVKVTNKSGTEKIKIDLNSGEVVLDSTVTNGEVTIRGIGTLVDNSTGTTINADDLLSRETITKVSWGVVHCHAGSGHSGTAFPCGTISSPVDNLADAKSIADANSIKEIHLHGDFTLTGDWSGYIFRSDSYETAKLTCSAATLDATIFRDLEIVGSSDGTGEFLGFNCIFSTGFTNMYATLENCQMYGTFTVAPAGYLNGDRCTGPTGAIFNVQGTGGLGHANWSGIITVVGAADPAWQFGLTGYYILTIHSSCTAGTILAGGIGLVTDLSTGMTFINKTVPATVWDEPLADHETSGTIGERIGQLLTKAWSFVK